MEHERTCPAVAVDTADMGPCTCRFAKPRECECVDNQVCEVCHPDLVARYESEDYPPSVAWYKENVTVDEMLAHIAPKQK